MGIALITNNILTDSGTAVAGLVPTSRTISTTAPLTGGGDLSANRTIAIPAATTTVDGYLSAVDWTTFNGKQAAGNYITSLTGEATGTGPGATAVTLNNASVTGKVLTGVNITGGTVLATDTMLTAFGKLQNQINGLIGSTIYQGVWNASTNTPTLASGVGTNGFYYIVNVAGSTNLDGITDWKIGDWAIFNGGVWQKVDNTESVTSVNGFTGAVSLTTDNVAQGTTNLYFSNASARAAVSLTTTGSSGAATYNNTTGVFNIPNYGLALADYVTLGTEQTITARKTFSDVLTASVVQIKSGTPNGVYLQSYTSGYLEVGVTTEGTTYYSNLVFPYAARTYTFPNASGTIALVGGAGVGTVTSVAALTLGTTGTDLSSTVATGTTTPVITLNVPTASATNRGALSAADWTTFNSKQNALTNPVTGSGTTNYVPKFTGASTIGNSTLQEVSGNLGLGVTPPAWSAFKAINIFGGSFSVNSAGGGTVIARNWYFDGNEKYFADGTAQRMEMVANGFFFQAAVTNGSGAGAALTWTSPMTLAATGNLLINTQTDSGFRLDVNGTGRFSSFLNANAQTTAGNGSINIESSDPALRFRVTSGTADNRIYEWRAVAAGGVNNIMQLRLWNDAQSSASTLFSVSSVGAGTFTSSVTANGKIFSIAGGTDGGEIRLTNSGGGNSWYWAARTTGLNLGQLGVDDNRIFVANSGNVLINTTTDAGFRLDVNGTGRFSGQVQLMTHFAAYSDAEFMGVLGFNRNPSTGAIYNNARAAFQIQNNLGTFQLRAFSSAGADLGTPLSIASTGAATFSSSVTAGTYLLSLGQLPAIVASSTFMDYISTNISRFASTSNATNTYAAIAISQYSSNGSLGRDAIFINPSGNIGIGTITPTNARLEVIGGIPSLFTADSAASSPTYGGSIFYRNHTGVGQGNGITFSLNNSSGTRAEYAYIGGLITTNTDGSHNGTILFAPSSNGNRTERMLLNNGGVLAINGNSSPSSGGYDRISMGFEIGVDGWIQTWSGRPLSLNSQGNNVLIGNRTDNGARFQVTGTSTISGQFVQGGGAARSTNGTTIAFTGGSQSIWTANSDCGDGGRFFSIVNELTSTNAFSGISFRVNPGGGSNNAMLDMKFVNSNNNNASTLYWSFLSGGSFFDRMSLTSGGNLTASAFFESSDKTIKTLIEDNYQTKGIESVTAKLYTKNGKEELGYYAQDVQGILPSAVSKGADGLLSLSYREVLVAKVQRTESEIDKLKRRVSELEQQLNLN
jgi:hypothetical protein